MIPAGQYAGTVSGTTHTPVTLNATQVRWATLIVDACYSRAGVTDRDVVCALACVQQESRFFMYANDGSDTNDDGTPKFGAEDIAVIRQSLALPHDKVGDDSASVGLFQQQPKIPSRTWGWGTVAQCMDLAYSTNAFLNSLLRIANRPAKPLTVLVQTVQGSSYPDAYARWEPLAWSLLAAYWRNRTDLSPVMARLVGVDTAVHALTADVGTARREAQGDAMLTRAEAAEQHAEVLAGLADDGVRHAELVGLLIEVRDAVGRQSADSETLRKVRALLLAP